MGVEQPPPENLSEDQKNFWMEKQAEANAAKRALQELATHPITKRRRTTKTQPPEEMDVEPPDPTQDLSQASQVEKLAGYDLHALVETHVPTARRDQYSDQLRAVGWKLSEFTATQPSPSSATGSTEGAAILARSHLTFDSFLDVLSCAQTVEDHEPTDFAAAIVHGCHSRILLVTCYYTDSRALVRSISRSAHVWERSNTPCTFHM